MIQKKNLGNLSNVRSISVKNVTGHTYSNGINAIRMMDDFGNVVVEFDLEPDVGTWNTERIPKGQYIVEAKSNLKYGNGLAFICWPL